MNYRMKIVTLGILLLLLTGCNKAVLPVIPANVNKTDITLAKPNYSIEIRQDSAPSGPLPTIFHQAKPRYEPFSRYGNLGSYAVNGQHYEVLRTAKGYKARGIASWYGTKFHRQRTSSGETYDMYAMTAAHKTLPLPTYVKVKNLTNGRETLLKINDRGPFHSDRLIDLSYAAATQLGLLPNGTAKVEIQAISGDRGGYYFGNYYIQAGAFTSKNLANLLQKQLLVLTHAPIFIDQYEQKYIVKIGPFSDKATAFQLTKKLTTQGIPGAFIVLQ